MINIIPVLLKSLLSGIGAFASKLILSLATEKFLERLFFLIADKYVESTKTDFDNKLLAEMKKAYEKAQ